MVKFFRRIRRKLIDERNLNRYMIYALGEIILVVVGILIALKLNNVNTEQDLRNKEFVLVQEIRNNLQANLDQFDSSINWQTERVADIEKIISYSKKGKPWNDTLGIAIRQFGNPEEFFINNSGYESLKSIGLDIISSDTLRNSITNLYEQVYKKTEIRTNQYGQVFFSTREPFMLKNFSYDLHKGTMTPNSPTTILNNQEFINLISQRRRIKYFVIGSNKSSIGATQSMIDIINEHLKKLSE